MASYINPPGGDRNPFRDEYDPELREHSEMETAVRQAQEKEWLRDHPGKRGRADWEFQRHLREASAARDDLGQLPDLEHETVEVPRVASEPLPGPDGETIKIEIVRRRVVGEDPETEDTSANAQLPCIFFIHGGLRVGSSRYTGLAARAASWATELAAVIVSVEYRLSPGVDGQPTGEAPLHDCLDALRWVFATIASQSHPLLRGVDARQVLLYGTSAGGGLAASLAIKWRAEAEPLRGLVLEAPQLDDRCASPSHARFSAGNMLTMQDAVTGWSAALGAGRGHASVSVFEAPARATLDDLRGLPPAYLDVGGAEPFADEVAAFAVRLRDAGVDVTCNTFAGGFHGFFAAVPQALISRRCTARKMLWISSVLGLEESRVRWDRLVAELDEEQRGRGS
ncbi:Alpha/Beta hydrolase protein [Xylariomycetidae sp. FL0641]|nr:Alpha/Beta hydrolase protein [Xylariomycetidae sp. FL0641]